jgi:hypothetical protein
MWPPSGGQSTVGVLEALRRQVEVGNLLASTCSHWSVFKLRSQAVREFNLEKHHRPQAGSGVKPTTIRSSSYLSPILGNLRRF